MTSPLSPYPAADREAASAAAGPAPFAFGTKAGTLDRLAPLAALPRFCAQLVVRVGDWRAEPDAVIAGIMDKFGGRRLAVRSSSTLEDTADNSNAGAYLSLTGVAPVAGEIWSAIERVIASYGDGAGDQEVLVQPMVEDVALSGVVLTRDLDTGGPYYVINYDDFSGRTDTVTGGAISKMVRVHRANPAALHSPRMRKIVAVAAELEAVTGREELDIEFCVTSEIEVYVLQVRPLAARRRWKGLSDSDIDRVIAGIRGDLGKRMTADSGIAGATTIFGEMPDWNPAEMIGNSPRPLALSLYKYLITDGVWADARAGMGYRHVARPLLVAFAGRPYIDTRLSFNSFLPADLDDGLAGRLVDYQLNLLARRPELHDKVEFEIAITCRDPGHGDRMKELAAAGFSPNDISDFTEAVGRVTNRALNGGTKNLRALLATTRLLRSPDIDDLPPAPRERAHALLEATKLNGTLPFSQLARHAFIGVALLRSLTSRGALTEDDAARFMRSIHTVAADLVNGMAAVAGGTLDEQEFLAAYGHLRPGTYDILSWRYDERPDLYLGHGARTMPAVERFEPSDRSLAKIGRFLAEETLEIEPAALLDYIATAIAAREEAKFAFTRGISDALSALVAWGEEAGFSREMLSYLDIGAIFRHDDPDDLRARSERGRAFHDLTRAIYLPHLIVEPDDIDVVRPLRGQPTFISGKSVTARTKLLDANEITDLDGRIVLIESADPGFDWIFSHNISALITKFGGVNSHMAIRCAEFGLPAAIGCGERTFAELARATVIELNCAARTVQAVGH